ncbi:uncharacterized protein LOC144886666 isoform X2 [Branchiostoma floridae x Branchiostoma japonicum]
MKLVSSTLLLFSCFAFATTSIDLDAVGQYKCTFDDPGACGWWIHGPVYSGGPAECDDGWPSDEVHGVTNPGRYMCFYLEHLPAYYPGLDRARLTSPTINTTQQVVMSFAIGTVRPPNSTYLNILSVNHQGTETLLCSTSDLLSPWQRIYVGVVEPGPYNIVIEGISNPPYFPNFGIDDLTLTVVENATANVGVQTTKCSTELLATVPMTTRQYNTTLPMTSSQVDTTTPIALSQATATFSQTSGQHVTTLPMTIISKDTTTGSISNSHYTTNFAATDSPLASSSQDMVTFPKTSSHDTTIMPMTSSEDTTILPMTGGQDTTIVPLTSSENATILPMTSSEDTTILPMASSQETTILPMTSGHDTTVLPTASVHVTPILPMTSSEDTTILPMASSQDTTILSINSSQGTTILPMASSRDTTVLPMTSKQEETTHIVSDFPTTKTTDNYPTTSQDKATSGITKNPTSKTDETTKRPIPSKTLLTTSKSGEAATKPLPTSTPSKDGQLGQQSGRTGQTDITALPIVLGIALFLLIAAGAMFYLKKKRKRSSFSVEESRRSSRMTLTQTELTEF